MKVAESEIRTCRRPIGKLQLFPKFVIVIVYFTRSIDSDFMQQRRVIYKDKL